jgi:hypothetical protein
LALAFSIYQSFHLIRFSHGISLQKEVERMKAQNEAGINQRRQQLADLYNREIEAWRAETIARVETQEDRKAR